MEIEPEALKKEKDKASQEQLERLKKDLAELNDKLNAMKGQWQLGFPHLTVVKPRMIIERSWPLFRVWEGNSEIHHHTASGTPDE